MKIKEALAEVIQKFGYVIMSSSRDYKVGDIVDNIAVLTDVGTYPMRHPFRITAIATREEYNRQEDFILELQNAWHRRLPLPPSHNKFYKVETD